jgi:uncharacterized protein YjbI with pentapeptide repeats
MLKKFEVRNRWTNKVQFTAEIEVTPDMPCCFKLGLAVRWAVRNRADLTDADLTGADLTRAVLTDADLTRADLTRAVLTRAVLTRAVLTDADLTDADLTRADLTDADLTGAILPGTDLTDADLTRAVLTRAVLTRAVLTRAVLTRAVLRSFKADFWMTLIQSRAEIPALIQAMLDGKINGSQYAGECTCLVGTISKIRGVPISSAFCDCSSRNPAEQWFLMIKEGDKPNDGSGGGFALGKALEWALEYCVLSGVKLPRSIKSAAEHARDIEGNV